MANNSSIIVSDGVRNLYAYGYQHNNGDLTYHDLIDSALAANAEWDGTSKTIISPEQFLAEWHKLAIKKWDNPSEITFDAVENLSELAKSDDAHFDVDMDRGFIDTITYYVKDEQIFQINF